MLSSIYFMKYTMFMEKDDRRNNMPWMLFRYALHTKHNIVKIADDHKLGITQAYTLCLLQEGKTTQMNSLCATLHCDASNITGIVERLHAIDLIERQECSSDRRVKVISLTAKGTKLRQRIMDEINAMQMPFLEVLDDKESEMFQKLLLKVLSEDCTQ